MSDNVILASELLKLWREAERLGVEHETSVTAFTSAMWAELVSRGVHASDELVGLMESSVTEITELLLRKGSTV
jgi:hypothetical protein